MAAKRNPPDATRKEVAELRRRVKVLESTVKAVDKKTVLLAKLLLKLGKHCGVAK